MRSAKIAPSVGIFSVFAVLVGIIAVGFFSREDQGSSTPGQIAQNFKAISEQKKTVWLEDFRGKPILLHFWATWCPPCVEEIPELLDFARSLDGKGPLVILAVSLDRQWEEALQIFPSQKELPSNVVSVLDADLRSSELYGSYQFPETYLLDKELKIVTKWVGPQNWKDARFKEFLKKFY